MKKLLLAITIMITSFTMHAQEVNYQSRVDSLVQAMKVQDWKLTETKIYLMKSHKEFRTGTNFVIAGLIFAGVEYLVQKDNSSINETNKHTSFGYFAAGCFLIGGILMIDSHRYIGKAGHGTYAD